MVKEDVCHIPILCLLNLKNAYLIFMWKKPKGKYLGIWDRIKTKVLDRANYRCEICKRMPDNFKKNYNPIAYDNITTRHFRVHHKDLNKSNNDLSKFFLFCQVNKSVEGHKYWLKFSR